MKKIIIPPSTKQRPLQIGIWLTPELHLKISKLAEEKKTSISKIARYIIEHEINNYN